MFSATGLATGRVEKPESPNKNMNAFPKVFHSSPSAEAIIFNCTMQVLTAED
jgi:hypothetical protein